MPFLVKAEQQLLISSFFKLLFSNTQQDRTGKYPSNLEACDRSQAHLCGAEERERCVDDQGKDTVLRR